MTPAELAAQLYQDPGGVSFRELVEAHLLGGYAPSTPEGFVLARPVDRPCSAQSAGNSAMMGRLRWCAHISPHVK